MNTEELARLGRFQQSRRLVLFLLLAAAGVLLLFCASAPPAGELHEVVEAVGLSLIFVAILGRLWCTLHIGGRKSVEIVETGPYSISRNPLYFFSSIGAAGVGAQTGSVLIALAFGASSVAAFHVVILREEAFLKTAFAEDYRRYLVRVPRFFPRFALFSDAETLTVVPRRLRATLLDGLVFFLAIPLFEFIEWLQASGVLPVLARLP